MLRRIVLHSLLPRTLGIRCVALTSICMCYFRPLRVAGVVARQPQTSSRYRDGTWPGAVPHTAAPLAEKVSTV